MRFLLEGGSRIKNIVDELGGEKIDIVRWNESSQILIQNALKPAEVVEISLCFELGRATVVVNEDQLSLAIGKRGQNVRLAARLTQWDVDILTPPEYTRGLDTMEQTLATVEGITEEHVDRLAALGVISVFDCEEVGAEYLMETLGIDQPLAASLIETASVKAKEVTEQQQREKEEAEKRKNAEEAELRKLPGEAQAAAVLGLFDPPEVGEGETPEGETVDTGATTPEEESEMVRNEENADTAAGGGDILEMLENSKRDAAQAADDEQPQDDDGEEQPSESSQS